ncbi:MAG: 30S ribosomal protein S8 [Candidatus Paceibacterota bacterium]|jgi:small subunit ribosomal protein S8
MVTDSIGDLIIRIKNAGNTGKQNVSVPFSKMKFAVAELLSAKGFVGEVSKKGKGEVFRTIDIDLLYTKDGEPIISGVKRISKPSRRLYENSKNLKAFRKGYGMSVLSTPKGIMADVDAKKGNLGGELLFNIW